MSQEYKQLQRKQLDEKLSEFAALRKMPVPEGGWIKAIRNALGMSASNLADRVKISQPAVTQFEKKESDGGISLSSLRKLAAGLECELVYAFIPHTGLDEMVKKQARKHAERMIEDVARSMALEKQDISEDEKERQVRELTRSLLDKSIRDFWAI